MKTILANRICVPEKTSGSSELTGSEKMPNDFTFPVIRIDHKGRILYANRASFTLLREWNCLANDYLPEKLLYTHPGLLDLSADFDLSIETRTTRYQLDVVGFNESGYIGLYGFKTEYLPEDKTNRALRIEL